MAVRIERRYNGRGCFYLHCMTPWGPIAASSVLGGERVVNGDASDTHNILQDSDCTQDAQLATKRISNKAVAGC